jgi:hypothetical protein
MRKSLLLAMLAVGALVALMLQGTSATWAQQKDAISKKQLAGTWTLVTAESITKDGEKIALVEGANPKGLLVFDANRFSLQIISEYPKLASNDRLKTTLEENKAVAHGVLAYYGTYSVSDADKVLTFNIERSSFSNQNGGSFARIITALTADDLKFTNPASLAGRVNNFAWKRAR